MIELVDSPLLGQKVDYADNGISGLKKLSEKLTTCCKKPYYMIFVDLNMPEMNGIEMMQEI